MLRGPVKNAKAQMDGGNGIPRTPAQARDREQMLIRVFSKLREDSQPLVEPRNKPIKQFQPDVSTTLSPLNISRSLA
jgi:hypothetical protein